MQITPLKFSIQIIIVLSIAFLCHLYILKSNGFPPFSNKIVLSYAINIVLAIAIFITLFKLREKFKSQLGFLFMGGSFLKYLLFFIVFYPSYKKDGVISSLELFAFLTPYFLCLIIETIVLVKWLNKLD